MKVKYPCYQCGKQFTISGSQRQHIESVYLKVKYPCNICEKVFTEKGDVKVHIESVHVTNVNIRQHTKKA